MNAIMRGCMNEKMNYFAMNQILVQYINFKKWKNINVSGNMNPVSSIENPVSRIQYQE